MKTPLELLSRIDVASPCTASWDDMTGDDYVRFCGLCSKSVYNLSALTTEAAVELIREKEGHICGRFYRRADGTMLTADCSVGVRRRVRRRNRLAALAASIFSLFGFGGCAKFESGGASSGNANGNAATSNSNQLANPDRQNGMIMGELCLPDELKRRSTNEMLPPPRELESD